MQAKAKAKRAGRPKAGCKPKPKPRPKPKPKPKPAVAAKPKPKPDPWRPKALIGTTRTSISLDADARRRLTDLASAAGVSRSELIRQILAATETAQAKRRARKTR